MSRSEPQKFRSCQRTRRAVGAVVATILPALAHAPTASAANRFWDPDGDPFDNQPFSPPFAGLGGSGTWDASSPLWWDGTSNFDQVWNDAANDTAVFWSPAAGNVTVSGSRTASGLLFKTNGYHLFGGSLTLAGPATVSADADVTATLSPILLGSAGLVKNGAGTVFINNINNELTGPVIVNAGVLAFSHESLTPNDKSQLGRVPASNTIVGGGITLNGATLRAELFQGGQGPPPPATLGPTRRIDLGSAGGTLDVVGGVILGLGADGGGSLASGGIYSAAGGRLTKTGAGRVAVSKNTANAPHSFRGLTIRQGVWSIYQTDAVVDGTGGNPLGAQPPANPPSVFEADKYGVVLDYNGLGGGAVLRFRGISDPAGTPRTDITVANNRPVLIGPGGGTIDTNGSSTSHLGTGGPNTAPYSGIRDVFPPGSTRGSLTKVGDGEFYHGGYADYRELIVNRGSWAVANGSQLNGLINVTLDTGGSGTQPATLRIVEPNFSMPVQRALTIGPGGGTICTDSAGAVWNGPLIGSGTLTKAGYSGLVPSPLIGDSAGAGSLTLSTDSPNFSGGIVVRTGTLVAASALKLGNDTSPGNTLTLDGGTFRAAASYAMTRAVTIGACSANIDTSANELTLAAGVSGLGAGSLFKTGTGTLRLLSNGTFDGDWFVENGTLQLHASGAMGVSNERAHFAAGTTLQLHGGVTLDRPVGISGATLRGANGSSGVSQNIAYNAVATFDVAAGATLTASGTIAAPSDSSLIKAGAGALALTSHASLSGGEISVTDGTIAHSAGTTQTDTVIVGTSGGSGNATYALSGGALSILALTVNANGAFNRTGGVLAVEDVIVNGGSFDIGVANVTLDTVTLNHDGAINGTTISALGGYTLNSGSVSANLAGGAALAKSTDGTVTLTGGNTYTGATTVNAGTLMATQGIKTGAALTIAGGAEVVVPPALASGYDPVAGVYPAGSDASASKVSSLTINGTGRLDLGNSDMIIDHGGSSPLADIRDLIASGYNLGAHDGPGIISTTALNTDPFTFALGYAENADLPIPYGTALSGGPFSDQNPDATAVLIKFTWIGDVTLDGILDFQDLSIFNGHYDSGATSGRVWTEGDLNYDGTIDFQDLSLFNGSYDPGKPSLPEPAALALLSLISLGVRRARNCRWRVR